MRSSMLLAMALIAPLAAASDIAAQSYPTKPVRMVVGFPPGGATDLVARAIQPRMSAALGRQVVIDNRAGANGIISGELVAHAEPDGYTILFGHIGILVISPAIQKVPYDAFKDFAPIGQAVSLQNLIITHPTLPAKTLKDLIALAKAKPGQINYASSGIGSPGHLAAVLLESMANIKMPHIPYKGGGPALTDLLAGQVPVFFSVISTGVPHVQAGKARGLAVTGTHRAKAIPDIPTVAEAGVPGYEVDQWYGVVTGAKVPPAIIRKLHAAIVESLKSPDVVQRLGADGSTPVGSTPEQFSAHIKSEIVKWRKLAKDANLVLQ